MLLYFFSGLGADKRVFGKLRLTAGYEVRYVDWIAALPEETLAGYAIRLMKTIDLTGPVILAGVSFGGMIAIEISKHCQAAQTVIISSISGPSELSAGMVRAGRWQLHRLIPVSLLLRPSAIMYRLFGTHSAEERQMLRNILADTDPVFFRWAMKAMTGWNNTWKPAGLLHLHGTEDRILPWSPNMQAIKVVGGGHLMVYSHAALVSTLLAENLPAPHHA